LQVILLLRQLPVPENCEDGDSGLTKQHHIYNQELEKVEILRKELEDKTEEFDKIKSQLAAKEQGLNKVELYMPIIIIIIIIVSNLSDDRSTASSKTIPPLNAI
jgi:hypothetical protein